MPATPRVVLASTGAPPRPACTRVPRSRHAALICCELYECLCEQSMARHTAEATHPILAACFAAQGPSRARAQAGEQAQAHKFGSLHCKITCQSVGF